MVRDRSAAEPWGLKGPTEPIGSQFSRRRRGKDGVHLTNVPVAQCDWHICVAGIQVARL